MKQNKHFLLLATVFIALSLLLTYFIAKNNAQNKLQQAVKTQLLQVVNKLEIILGRHAYLPALIANDQAIINFMAVHNNHADNDSLVSQINTSLELTNNTSGASSIFLMDLDGTTIASSNWFRPTTFVGKNFSYRPYFQQAKQNILGRYFAVGSISGQRGYFFARAIHSKEKMVGVVVVKIDMEEIEFTWGQGSFEFMVTDRQGIIFLSSQEEWNLHSLSPLTAQQKRQVITSRRYGNIKIDGLDSSLLVASSLDRSSLDILEPLNNQDNAYQTINIDSNRYEILSKKMILADWDVRVLASHKRIQKTIFTSMIISFLVLILLTLLGFLLLRSQQHRKKYQLQITEELENKVIERTKALKQSQEDLIQAAKMAALGQLSAGITHEINNPLTAIRAYTDNAKAFLKKDRLAMVEENLTEISQLTESMATITSQLKSFSRKSKGEITPLLVGHAINNALSIVNPKIISSSVICHWDDQSHGANKSILADNVWFGQILVNLVTNAISATQQNKIREIWITIVSDSPDNLCIQVKDNGIGIEEKTLPHIFEPFFTTKPSSKGLGLGLSISFNLAKDMNGSLTAINNDSNNNSGATFSLCLPVAK